MLLDKKTFVVKQKVQLTALTYTYDLLDPENEQPIGVAKEEPSGFVKFARLALKDMKLPTKINVYEPGGTQPVVTLKHGFAFVRPTVEVLVGERKIAQFIPKLFSMGGGFQVQDPQGQANGTVDGDWKGWNFTMKNGAGQELGKITKTWSGLGRGLLGADSFVIAVNDSAASTDNAAMLLARGLAIELILQERTPQVALLPVDGWCGSQRAAAPLQLSVDRNQDGKHCAVRRSGAFFSRLGVLE